MLRILLILLLLFSIEINAIRRRCINSGVVFPDKIFRSPFVVYGESITKKVYLDTNTEQLFNLTFRVDCVFKGQDVENQIEITEAGIKTGHTACQWLEPGQFYVVFLEKWGMKANGYRPYDFQELLADNMTYEVLAKTCHLIHIQPLHSSKINTCPNVSMTQFCPHDEIDVSIMPKEKHDNIFLNNIKSSFFGNDNQFYLQSNVTIPKDGIFATQMGDDRKNDACSLTIPSFLMIVFMPLIF